MLTSKFNSIEFQRNEIKFANGSDLCTGRVECVIKFQEIVDYSTIMNEATGVNVQKDKIIMNVWKWENYQKFK